MSSDNESENEKETPKARRTFKNGHGKSRDKKIKRRGFRSAPPGTRRTNGDDPSHRPPAGGEGK